MTPPEAGLPNPYVGPRAFLPGEPLFGRGQETGQLANLLVAERIVLLYSPSGAGKTSLIQAALVPRLEKMKFQVLPVIRVNLEAPESQDGGQPPNRYLFSALVSLQEGLPAEDRRPPEALAGLSLADGLATIPPTAGGRGVEILIFDQFEELLALDPTDGQAKREFFRQVGEALAQPNRWALFAMREDYLAALDPYLLLVPNRFSCGFRLDLLGREAALQAVQEPARTAGVHFEDRAAEKLVDDLRRVRVQRPDGRLEVQAGPAVEPVQLQVVCRRLWEMDRPNRAIITEGDLASLGEVDGSLVDLSLSDYWASSASEVAAETGVSERTLREWVDRRLITPGGDRNTLRMQPESSGGLDNRAIQGLIDAHLVRAEKRGGAIWFELAHDRLVIPVRRNNAAWFRAHLSLLQQRADAWDQGDRPESLLLRDKELIEAERWARGHPAELLPAETEYLQASRALHDREQRARRLRGLISLLGLLAAILAVIAWIAYGQARQATREAQKLERAARAGQLAAQAQGISNSAPVRSLLLAVEAISTTLRTGEAPVSEAENALRLGLHDPHGVLLGFLPGPVDALVGSPDGRWLAAESEETLQVWDLAAGNPVAGPRSYGLNGESLSRFAFQPGEQRLVAASDKGKLRLWDLEATGRSTPQILRMEHETWVSAISFSPDGRRLAAGSTAGEVRIWDLSTPDLFATRELKTAVTTLAFSPDGRTLAVGGLDGLVRLLDPSATLLAEGIAEDPDTSDEPKQITALAFSPDGRRLATGGLNSFVTLWDLSASNPLSRPEHLLRHGYEVGTLAFSPDGRILTAGLSTSIAFWNLDATTPEDSLTTFDSGPLRPQGLEFSPDGRWLAALGGDTSVNVWDLEHSKSIFDPLVLRGHDGEVLSLAFLPGGRLATGGEDGTVRLSDLAQPQSSTDPLRLSQHDLSYSVSISADGDRLVAPIEEGVGVWDLHFPDAQVDEIVPADFIASSGQLLVAGGRQGIQFWDLSNTGSSPAAQNMEPVDGLSGLALSSDGHRLAVARGDGSGQKITIELWALSGEGAVTPPQALLDLPDLRYELAFGPAGHWLAAWSSSDPTVYLWDLRGENTHPELVKVESGVAPVRTVTFSPDERRMATGATNGTLNLWDLEAADPASDSQVIAQDVTLTSLAFSQDGSRLWGGDDDGRIWEWELRDAAGDQTAPMLTAHNDVVVLLVPSPDGRWLASGSWNGEIFLWELDGGISRSQPAVLSVGGELYSLVFSPDGRWLATGSDQGVHLWRLRLDELVRLACESAGRNFTQDEWNLYFPGEAYRQTCPGITQQR